MWKAGPTRRGQGGYTYVSLLVILVAVTLAAQTTFVPSGTNAQRAAEAELIFRGMAYRDAIRSYYEHDPDSPAYPETLEALLSDPRAPEARHIRRLYDPPMGGEWALIAADGGGIAGVAPKVESTPLKRVDFPSDLGLEEPVESYDDWAFRFEPAPPGQ